MAKAATALAYWVEAAGTGGLRPAPLPAPGPGDVALASTFSGISVGTERLVGRGLVPASCAAAMACQGMQGSFALPVCYGYSLVGTITHGAFAGRTAFTMHPHQDRVVVAADRVVVLPGSVPAARGTLLPNLETALNAVWDADLRTGETGIVVGGGAVGLLLTFVLATERGEAPALVESDPVRRQFAARLPWIGAVLAPEDVALGRAAVAFHTSATSEGLQLAIDAVGFEGRVVELSWYGARPVTLQLGETFHHERKRIVASQVGTVAASHRAAGRAARTASVLQLLADPRLDALLGTPIPFAQLPAFFARLYRGEPVEPCPVVAYDAIDSLTP